MRSGHVASRGSAVGRRGRRRGCARPGGHRLRRWVRFVRHSAGRRPASSGRLGGAVTRWSQIPIWDPSADDSDRYSFLNAERIPRGVRPGKDSGPSGSDLPYLLAFGWRIGIVMDAECGKDSAGDAARKGFRAERGSGPQIMGLTQMKNRKKVFEHEVTETGLRVPPRRLRCIHLLLVPYSTICQESRVDPDTPPSARPEGRRPRGRRLHIQTGEISALSERRWHKIHNNSKYTKKLVSFSQQYWHGR